MNTGPPGRTRQLALLAALVLALHLAVLRPGTRVLAPDPPAAPRFHTRTVLAVPPPQAETPLPTAPAVAPPPPPATSPAPAPRQRIVRAPAPARPRVATTPEPAPRSAAQPLPATLTALPSAVLHYEVTARRRGGLVDGQARLEWQQDGQGYAARLVLSAPGLRERIQQSEGAFTASGLQPERFSDRSRGELATHFDRTGGRVVFSNNQPEAALAAGMQDRVSVVLQLSMLAAAQPARFAAGTEIVIPTATARDAQDWIFLVRGEEDLALPGGSVRALKLERLPRREFDQRVELWLAPGQAYAPVRLRLTNPDGGWVDQRWSSTDTPGSGPRLN